MKIIYSIILGLILFNVSFAQSKINCDLVVENDDVSITNYQSEPGDTICILAGNRSHLYFKNILGSEELPVVIINYEGKVNINSELSYGMRFAENRYVKISGFGSDSEDYGLKIESVSNGSGLEIRGESSDFEVEGFEITGTKYVGIVAKTDPDCTFSAVRDSFTMYNVHIHDNYIHHVGTEGMYVGNSFFLGHTLNSCDTVVLPHIIDGVKIYNNKLEYIGWDGIQVGCALNSCDIYNNDICFDSQDEATYQMSGIMVNSGSRCNVFSNKIIDGKGTGILNQGAGGQHFYNNLIVNAGRDYYFEDQTLKQQFGIYSKYKYIEPPDSTFHFYNNTIINPKSDGIRYHNERSENNVFANNLIINPGAYTIYDTNGSVNNSGEDAYIHNYLHTSDVILKNNLFERNMKDINFADTSNNDFHILYHSPAYNTGTDISEYELEYDLDSLIRPFAEFYDIGAYELQSGLGINENSKINELLITPNVSSSLIRIETDQFINKKTQYQIISSNGTLIDSQAIQFDNAAFEYTISRLNSGMYYLWFTVDNELYIGSFIKI